MSPVGVGMSDLRLVSLGVIAWAATLLARHRPGVMLIVLVLLVLGAVATPVRRPGLIAASLVVSAVTMVGWAHRADDRASPTTLLAGHEGIVEVVLTAEGEARRSRFGPRVRVQARLVRAHWHGREFAGRRERVVLVLNGERTAPPPGSRLRLPVRFVGGDGPAPLVIGRAPPRVVARSGPVGLAVNRVRRAVREASSGLGPNAAALVPALVDGDESAGIGTDAFAADFRTAGMTHLLAVSGTNLTIILGLVLAGARWAGVRARGLLLAGALGVVGFVLLAGPEPSVLRAAVMGSVALIGLGRAGPGRGLRALGAAVLVLVLLDPDLAGAAGFVLSVLATAGILLLAPRLRRAMTPWTPTWIAEAVAVPLAAQLACTPVVAAISGQVSLIALGANLVVAPVVAPATVLGLAGGVVALLAVPAGAWVAQPAGWCADLMIAVARRAAGLPIPAVSWGTSAVALALLAGLCAVIGLLLPGVLRRPTSAAAAALVVTAAVLVPLPTPGWPPAGWVMVACAVGQGDALALRTGPGSAVVVDAGPDPVLVDRCLRRLRVRTVPVLVLTHFHADHVDGIDGVLRGRRVGRIDVSPLAEPASGARAVSRAARGHGVPVRVPTTGERNRAGGLEWRVLAPRREHPESESPPNDASLVLAVTSRGVRLLLLGDQETAAQADLRRAGIALSAAVVKVRLS